MASDKNIQFIIYYSFFIKKSVLAGRLGTCPTLWAVAIFAHIFVFRHHRYSNIVSSSGLDLYKDISLQALSPIIGQAPG